MIFGRRYRVTEKLGSGGMAEVYKAVDEVLGRTVAVKVMHPRYASDPTFAARFRQEAQAAANLQSPYIVNIYDWGQDGDTYYIVMELVRGTDLKSIIQQKGPLDSRRVADIGAQVCSALSIAHGYDVIHRDVKPHNIMVTPEGSVKVMDFGIARAGNTTMTQTGSVLGTAHYVSPEQAQGRPLTAASDLYSLGIVLFEAATGQLPFDADAPVAVALKQVNEAPPMPRQVNEAVDPGLETIILRSLAKDPTQRYDTAEAMRRDLLTVAQGRDVAPLAAGAAAAAAAAAQTSVLPAVESEPYAAVGSGRPPAKRKNRAWIWILVAALLVAAGLGLAYAMGLLGPQGAAVPDLVGKTPQEAETLVIAAGFTLGEPQEEFNKEIEKGVIYDQSPVAGATAEKGSVITITVSKGPRQVEVPDLKGITEDEALAAIEAAGLSPKPLPDEPSSKTPAGSVMKQNPDPGTLVDEGSTVEYVVSRGVETVKVPGVVGMSRSNAESTLQDDGFKVKVTEEYSESVDKGVVISQNPNKGLVVEKGSTVSIVVSKGPERIKVPDVIGETEADARSILEDAGLKIQVTYESHANNGMVLEQSPSPNASVARGSSVMVLIDGPLP